MHLFLTPASANLCIFWHLDILTLHAALITERGEVAMYSLRNPLLLQEHETEYNLATMVENSKAVLKADPSQFELLKVLGQGSFGKVRY